MEGGGGDTLGMRLYQLHIAAKQILLSSKNIYYDPTMCQVLFYVLMNDRHGSLELSRGMRQLIESQYCTNNSRRLRKTKHDDGMESRVHECYLERVFRAGKSLLKVRIGLNDKRKSNQPCELWENILGRGNSKDLLLWCGVLWTFHDHVLKSSW